MYRATVTTNDQEQKYYIGMTESSFTSRFRNHKMSFNNEKYSSSTTLSTHIWKLKKTNTKHKVQWSIIKRASAFRSGAKQCNLCPAEKLCILKADKQSLLNKRSELLSKCRRIEKRIVDLKLQTHDQFVEGPPYWPSPTRGYLHWCRFLSFEDRKSIVQAIVMSRIDYCNSLLYGVTATNLTKHQRVQRVAARLVCSVPRHEHVTPSLISLHWLPIRFRINFKIAMFAFKCIHGQAPSFLKNLIAIKKSTRHNLRSSSVFQLQYNSTKTKKTLGDRTFTHAAARVWNSLPQEIRTQKQYSTFKSKLKTYYFKQAFDL